MVPAQVQQRPAKSTALPLPRTNPVPEVATTSMLDRRKNDSKRQVPKHEFKYHPLIKFKKRKEKKKKRYSASNTITMYSIWYAHNHLSELFIQPAGTPRAYMGKRRPTPEQKMVATQWKKVPLPIVILFGRIGRVLFLRPGQAWGPSLIRQRTKLLIPKQHKFTILALFWL